MHIRETIEGDALTLALEGRLDTLTAPQLEEKLATLLPGKKAFALDFAALDYLSSAGLRVILAAQKRMQQQGEMVIRHVNEAIMEVFEVTGFLDILTIEPAECTR
ncbi:MAG: STAS domain-containing protein [Oscillospiraceae bacterium]|jgi:anti-sigma B factor antagonist|nr:STAS domain-containing protein [Oscillospiraceae bacterium]